MKRKIRYQAKTDLKLLRRINGISKEYVADKIGYTIRSLERMEKENAVTTEPVSYTHLDVYKRQGSTQYDRGFGIDTLSGTPAAAKEPVFRSIRCGMCGQEPAVLQDYGCRKSTAFIISQGMGGLFF